MTFPLKIRILWILSHKRELNTAVCSNMDGPRDCQTE